MAKFNLGTLLGDRDLDNLMGRVDALTSELTSQKRPDVQTKDSASAALKEFLGSIQDDKTKETGSNVQQLMQNITVPAQRTNRYMIYDEMYSSVQLIKSIIRVYSNNILASDVVTGKCLVNIELPENKTDTEQTNKYKDFVRINCEYFNIETHLKKNILPDLLKYGDHFVEIIDLVEDVVDMPTPSPQQYQSANQNLHTAPQSDIKVISESFEYIEKRLKRKDTPNMEFESHSQALDEFVKLVFEFDNSPNEYDMDLYEHIHDYKQDNYTLLTEAKDITVKNKSKAKIDGFTEDDLKRFVLRFHKPKNLVALTTTYNNTIVGYVEVREGRKMEVTPGVGMQFASMIKQVSAVSKDKSEDHGLVVRKIVRKLIEKLVVKLDVTKNQDAGKTKQEVNKQFEDDLHKKLGDDLFFIVKKLYIESDPQAEQSLSKIKVRFISSERITHFCLNPNEYSPYGTSVIDPLIYPGKLYLLSQLTNVVTKLSRASLLRKWTIETGPREHHTSLMQKLKRELRNQRVTVDDIVSFKSIPKILSDFKDMILLTKKGVKFVDVKLYSVLQ